MAVVWFVIFKHLCWGIRKNYVVVLVKQSWHLKDHPVNPLGLINLSKNICMCVILLRA